jgi:hypothetical protein
MAPDSDRTPGSRNRSEIVGVQSVNAEIGRCMTWWLPPFTTYIFGSWCFDKDGKLIDICVEKGVDAL